MYGKELILDLDSCDSILFTRKNISLFFISLCDEIDMEPCEQYWWDYGKNRKARELAPAHLAGVSAVQFIKTSNITIHTLDKLNKVFLNIFSCKQFDVKRASEFCSSFFKGKIINKVEVNRL